MNKTKNITRKIFCLPPVPTFLIAVPSFLLVAYVLLTQTDGALAYFAYFASAYALLISLTTIFHFVSLTAQRLKNTPLVQKLLAVSLVRQFLADINFRAKFFLSIELFINLFYIILELIFGIYYHSVWFISLSVYYLLLAIMRFMLLRPAPTTNLALRRCRSCGAMLLVMNQALAGIVILIVKQNHGYEYHGTLIYAMAAYSFYAIIIAVVNVLRFRKYASPILQAAKAIKLVAALVSILALETAMLNQFDSDNGPLFRQTMTAATGGSVCIIVLAIALFIIVSSTKKIRKINQQDLEQNIKECSGKDLLVMPKETFVYTYSASQQEEVKRIREKYAPATPAENKLEKLRQLDKKAARPGKIAALTVSILGVLGLGVGMCCTMVWDAVLFAPGIIIGVAGIVGICAAYPLNVHITKKQRSKLAPEIIRLTDELIK